MNTLCVAVVQSLVLSLAFGPIACGTPNLSPATDLGADKSPADAALVFTNTSSAPIAVFVRWSADVDAVPSWEPVPSSEDGRVGGTLVAGAVYPPGASTGDLVVPVFLHHVVRYTVETWDPATGDNRHGMEVHVPGNVPTLVCSVTPTLTGLSRICQ